MKKATFAQAHHAQTTQSIPAAPGLGAGMDVPDQLTRAVPRIIYVGYGLVFLLALTLRIALALVNPAANDDHMEVVQLILKTESLPTKNDCWECFQPKPYHATLAGLFRTFSIEDAMAQVLFANLLNSVAGGLTLVVIAIMLIRLPAPSHLSLLAFAFAALNPELIGISAQATNDSFLILFSTLALFFFGSFLVKNDALSMALTILFVTLAVSTKSNGMITFVAIAFVLFVRFLFDKARRARLALYIGIYLILCTLLVVINPLNQYIENYEQHGRPWLLNMHRYPLPRFIEPTYYRQPGIVSIVDGFLTFKISSLIAHPRIERCGDCPKVEQTIGEYAHRTSLWTQLYARAHSVNFANWPSAWAVFDTRLFPVLRAIYLLALIPSGLIVYGSLLQLWQFLQAIWKRDLQAANELQFGIFPIVLYGYVAFVMLYALFWRDFTVMKIVFIYPALPALPMAFLAAIQNRPPWFNYCLAGLSLPLFCLYAADILSLVFRLA